MRKIKKYKTKENIMTKKSECREMYNRVDQEGEVVIEEVLEKIK
jgi:hypothetical protein